MIHFRYPPHMMHVRCTYDTLAICMMHKRCTYDTLHISYTSGAHMIHYLHDVHKVHT